MNFEIFNLDEMKVIGIKMKTSNANAQIDIPKLWEKFYSENIISKISPRINEDVLSVYTDYEGNYTKPYTLILGCKVKNADNVPEGMISKTIVAAKYAVFKAEGELPQSIVKVWQFIWNSDLDRTYVADFDLHKSTGANAPLEVEVYVGIN